MATHKSCISSSCQVEDWINVNGSAKIQKPVSVKTVNFRELNDLLAESEAIVIIPEDNEIEDAWNFESVFF